MSRVASPDSLSSTRDAAEPLRPGSVHCRRALAAGRVIDGDPRTSGGRSTRRWPTAWRAAARIACANPVFASLYEELSEFARRPGKRLRPLLFLLGHRIFHARPGRRCRTPCRKARCESMSRSASNCCTRSSWCPRRHHRPRGNPPRVGNPAPGVRGPVSLRSPHRHRAGRNLALVLGDILFALAQKCLLEAALPAGMAARLGRCCSAAWWKPVSARPPTSCTARGTCPRWRSAEIEQMYCLKTTCYTMECPLAMAAVLAGLRRRRA